MRQNLSVYRCARIYRIGCYLRALKTNLPVVAPAVMLVLLGTSSDVSGQVQERSRLLLRDVAVVTLDSSGKSQIDFNPAICRRLGPELCEYFRAHEYGHVNLRHLERGVPTRQAEREADVWAAQNASPAAVEAARKYFARGNGGSRYHGSSQERADRLSSAQVVRQSTPATTSNRIVLQKPAVSGTTVVNQRVATQYSGGSRTTVVRQPVSSVTQFVRQSVPGSNRTIVVQKPAVSGTTVVKQRVPTQYSGGSRSTVVRNPVSSVTQLVRQSILGSNRTIVVRKPAVSGTASTTTVNQRIPAQYSTGSGTKTVRITASPSTGNARRVIYNQGSAPATSSFYVPRGGFNNPSR